MSGGNRQPKILSYTRDRRGKITNYHEKDLANTIHTSTGSGGNTDQYTINGYSVRKLTPTECFRLMDVSDQNIQKIQNSGVSKSQQYRMAGNSIVVSCMENIFKILFKGYIKTNISPSIITNN
jgi:DNA (cytosine-5)-methyltransferase 1